MLSVGIDNYIMIMFEKIVKANSEILDDSDTDFIYDGTEDKFLKYFYISATL